MPTTFADFTLDPANRRLTRDGAPVDVQGRYFDALALMAAHPGQLVTKDRFMDEVWRGVPVTDEALTQCMRALRKALGDDASNPRFIETVPKHGYRFIAPVGSDALSPDTPVKTANAIATVAAGTLGGGVAGLAGGIAYGLLLASQQPDAPGGAFSLLLVMAMICTLVAMLGALGVSGGIAAGDALGGGRRRIIGGMLGGGLVGFTGKLLSLDAFHLVVGKSPGNVTGGLEGLVLGAAAGLGAMLAMRQRASTGLRRSLLPAAVSGAAAGAIIPLVGGRMMAGSLDLMSRSIPGSQLRLGGLFGEGDLGLASQVVLGIAEGVLFVTLLVGGIELAARARRAG